MMHTPQLPLNGHFTQSVISELQSYLDSLVPHGDNVTTSVDWDASGFIVKALDQGAVSEGEGGASAVVFPIEIISGTNGAYKGYKVDAATGESTSEIVDIFATRATAYDLSASSNAVGFVVIT